MKEKEIKDLALQYIQDVASLTQPVEVADRFKFLDREDAEAVAFAIREYVVPGWEK